MVRKIGQIEPYTTGWGLCALALSMLLSSLGISISNVALPAISDTFSASYQAVQWIIISYLLAMTVIVVSVGRLGDMIGHRRLLMSGICVFSLASVLCSVAPTLGLLVLARAVQGVGAAVLMVLAVALVRETVPSGRIGAAMGLLGTMSATGTALGPALGGMLIGGFGWRAIFLIMVPLGILNAALVGRWLPADGVRPGLTLASFDVIGAGLLGLTLTAYALAVTVGGGDFGWKNIELLLAAVLGAGLFGLLEAHIPSPLLRLATFRNVQIRACLGMNALVATVMMATLVVGPFYLSRGLELEIVHVGMVMSIGPMVSIICGIPAGRAVDRLGARFTMTVGLAVMAVGAFGLSVLPAIYGIVGYIAATVLLTPGYQLFQAANNTIVMMGVAPDRRGVISGVLGLSRNLGLITGASVMGGIFNFASGACDVGLVPPCAVGGGMQITFAIAGGLVVIAFGIAVRIRSTPA